MTVLTLNVPPEVHRRLDEEASRLGKPLQAVAEEWLAERMAPPTATPSSDRERAHQALCAAGLLAELGPNLRSRADSMVRLEDINVALGRAGGKTLGEIVLEQRGPKE